MRMIFRFIKINLMKKILFSVIIGFLSMQLYGQDSAMKGKTGYTKGNQSDFRRLMREGNRQYDDKKTEDAERSYLHALGVDDKSERAIFNLGDALYRQKKYDEAGKRFEEAASAMTNKADRARAYHNLGNSYLQQQKLKESIEAYKQALRNNPGDADTKYNLSYAMNMLKEQQQQQQQKKSPEDEEVDKIVEQAKKLVAQRKYQEAHNLMKEGEKKNPKLSQYADFTNRILDIIKMN
jgi:tetratricopeptide (TPR) repeat protein